MRKTVFVLGAGATRGCSFVNELKQHGHCIPPLDADYFTQLQRVANKAHSERIKRLIEGMVQWFGPNYALGMEQVFCHLEHAQRMLKHLGKDAGGDFEKVADLKKDLIQSIAIILGESLTKVKDGGQGSYELRECKWHFAGPLFANVCKRPNKFIINDLNYSRISVDMLK